MILPENKPREIKPTEKIKMFLYGDPYTGKTTFASKFPNPILLSTDGNYELIDTPAIRITTIAEWETAIKELEAGKHTFETVVVDLADQLYDLVRDEVLKSSKIIHETDLGHGKGWHLVRKPVQLLLYRLASLPYNVIFIGHSKIGTGKDRVRGEFTYVTSLMPELMVKYLQGLVTYTLYTAVEKEAEQDEQGNTIITPKHYLYLNAIDESIKGGSRVLFKEDRIDLDYDKFIEVLTDSIYNPIDRLVKEKVKKEVKPLKALKPLKPLKEETKVEEQEIAKNTNLNDFN